MSPSLTTHDTRRRDALSIDALVERPSTRQCGKCQEAQSRCDGREPCRNCEVRGTLCGYAWSSFSSPHTLPPLHQAPPAPQGHPVLYFSPPSAKRRSPVPTGSIFPRSNALDGGWAIVPQGTNAPAAPHPPGPVVACKTCQARNTPCDGVTPVCGSCRVRRLECYLATPAGSSSDRRNGNGATMTWSARDRQALNPRSFPPSLSQAAMLLPPANGPSRPRAPSDANKPSSSRTSLSFMLNPNTEGKVASGSKGNGQRPSELKNISTNLPAPIHHVTPPTPVAPASMEKAQAAPPSMQMDIDVPTPTSRDPPTSPSSSTSGTMGGMTDLSRRPSRKRSASPENYGPEREDSPGRESVSSLGVSALNMNGRRTRALSHVHSPRGSMDSYNGRHVLEPHSPRSHSGRGSVDPNHHHHHRGSMESHTRTSLDSAQSPTRSQSHSTRNSVDLHSRGQPLDEAQNSHSERSHSNRPMDSHPGRPSRPADPHPVDAHASHRRSIDQTQGLASPVDSSRPRSRSKSSLSHLLDGGGFGGMGSSTSPTHTTPPHTRALPHAHIPQNAHIQAPHTTPPHTHVRPPRTPSSEFGPGPSPTATSASASESFARPMSAESPGRTINREAGVAYRDPAHHEPVSPTRRESGPSSHREPPVHRDAALPHRDPSKQASISTALADIHLKSAGTSRASSPGHGRHDVFVHSAFNGPGSGRHAWTTFGTAGENMASSEGRAVAAVAVGDTRAPAASEGRMANVWRHETEAGMRRREAEAELRKQESQGHVDLHRRRSEGAKRRKIGDSEDEHRTERERGMSGATDERRMSIVEPERRSSGAESDRRMSIVEPERRMSIVEPDKHPVSDPEKRNSMAEPERRMSIVEPEKRMTGVETERNNSIPESGRRLSIVEHVRRATGVAPKDSGHRATSNSLPNPRVTTTVDAFARSRRGSVPMPGAWTDDPKSQSVIVISDSPEAQTGDTEMDIPEQSEPLFPDRSAIPDTKSDSTEGSRAAAEESTPLGPFGHIWPPPPIPVPTDLGKKGRRTKPEPESTPVRSFITPLNLPPPPPTTQVKQSTPIVDDEVKERDKDKDKDKESGNSSQPSVLRSMLTTMPTRVTFMNEVQNFLSQPPTKTRRNRAVIMTKALMKDALGVLLDPNTDELLKDYVPPEKKKDEEKPGKDKERDGTPVRGRKMSVAIDLTDHSSLEFRAWARRMFSTVKTSRGEDALAFDGKPVVVEDDIYETIVICHSQGNHCSTDETAKLVDLEHSWVPRALIEAFVQKCPGCPLENKATSTTTKPKKRKSVRGAGGPKRKPAAVRRGKKAQDGEGSRRSRKSGGKEVSPEESDGEENDQEEDELKESGDEAGPSDVKTELKSDHDPDPTAEDQDNDQDQDQDQDEPDLEPDAEAIDDMDDAEEPEMESEDEHVSAPSSSRPKNA